MGKIKNTVAAVLHFDFSDESTLKRVAQRVADTNGLRKPGGSAERYLAYLAGRAALSWVLRECGAEGVVAPDPSFGYLRFFCKKPPNKTLHVNISHTSRVAVAVASQGPVGIDVEEANRKADRAYSRVATPDELMRLPDFCATQRLPTVCLWTGKEAFSKAVGLGLKFGLRQFEIILDGSAPYRAHTSLRGPIALADPALVFELRNPYLVSLCAERPNLLNGIRWLEARASELV